MPRGYVRGIRSPSSGRARPLDVESGAIHQVRPWFAGKVDFAPAVLFPGDADFPLRGGTVERSLDRQAAVLVYARRLHPVSLLVFQANGSRPSGAPASAARTSRCWASPRRSSASSAGRSRRCPGVRAPRTCMPSASGSSAPGTPRSSCARRAAAAPSASSTRQGRSRTFLENIRTPWYSRAISMRPWTAPSPATRWPSPSCEGSASGERRRERPSSKVGHGSSDGVVRPGARDPRRSEPRARAGRP